MREPTFVLASLDTARRAGEICRVDGEARRVECFLSSREAEKRGLNPNVWFGNVERIASERIGRETVTYVANIYKYCVAYRLIVEERDRRTAAKATVPSK